MPSEILVNIFPGNGLSPVRRQAITEISEIWIKSMMIFIKENAFKNDVCKVVVISTRCV